ncbi:TonB-dependent receptor [plant metagenome]|uniref:TonB-dependent receptor n=1 Tax=plant metagenome TaxID=1297885 RepID=A0A484P7W2_9ZZZZ
MPNRTIRTKHTLLTRACSLALLAVAAVNSAAAQTGDKKTFSVPAQPAAAALNSFASQADVTLVFSPDAMAGIQTGAVNGDYTPEEALQRLLAGTGLGWERTQEGALAVVAMPLPASADVQTSARTTLDTVMVTGTRIRGGTTASPLITIGSENIREEGFTDLGEVIRSLPQNSSGGQNPGVISGSTNIADQNLTGGSGLNLRGLGPDATLTLLNGRRLSYSGPFQAVDISAIPVEAVERIDIVADGASAIYGSDAVAGVGNVILKRDFEGVMVGTRYGTATEDGLTTREQTATAGTAWDTGGLIATWKHAATDPIYAQQRDYTRELIGPRTIYSSNELRSGLLSAHQLLADSVELHLDVLRTERDIESYSATAATYTRLPYATTTTYLSPSADILLPGEWMLSIGGTWGKDENNIRYVSTARSTGASSTTVDSCYCNESRSYEIGAEGPLFSLPGGDARLAVGAGYRKNRFADKNYLTGTTTTAGEEGSRFAYAEVHLPFVGPESSIVGIRRLAMSAALRTERYDSFGGVTTPKLGLVYAPNGDFTVKASWGKSFKAPTLVQLHQAAIVYNNPISYFGVSGYASDATALLTWGGNRNLKPERARTWSSSLAWHPEAVKGLEAELTWFGVDYRDRVVQPVGSWWLALTDSRYGTYVDHTPTSTEQSAVLANSTLIDYSATGYDPGDVVAIIANQYTNAMRQKIKGADLSASYRFDHAGSRWTIRGAASWLDISQQTAAGQPTYALTGTIYSPVRLNGRMGVVWDRGGFTSSAFVNYTDGVTASSAVTGSAPQDLSSSTTIDLTWRYGTGLRVDFWSDVEVVLAAQNVFDREPPLLHTMASTTAVPYDSVNYSAIGRYLSLSLSKRW